MTGDVLVHDTVWESAAREAQRTGRGRFNFRPMLAGTRDLVSHADLALCHLEVPLAAANGPYSGYPQFAAPQEVTEALRWAGYDGCTTASNHSIDQGFTGLARTLDVLDRVGLQHAGTARTLAESQRATVLRSHGMRIAWLSYTFSTNGLPVDPDKLWSVPMIDVPDILEDARRARAAGADAVLVALHWGNEYWNTPSPWQEDVARQLSQSPDITLVYGHHTHLVQPIHRVGDLWVVYGLGNYVADQYGQDPGTDTGLMAQVTLRQRGEGPVRVVSVSGRPLYIDRQSPPFGEIRVYDVRTALRTPGLDPGLRAELLSSRRDALDGLSR